MNQEITKERVERLQSAFFARQEIRCSLEEGGPTCPALVRKDRTAPMSLDNLELVCSWLADSMESLPTDEAVYAGMTLVLTHAAGFKVLDANGNEITHEQASKLFEEELTNNDYVFASSKDL